MVTPARSLIWSVACVVAVAARLHGQVPYLVKDIRPGPDTGTSTLQSGRAVALGARLFLNANDGINGSSLWVSNGTADGTYMVADVAPGPSDSFINSMAVFKGRIFFQADDGVSGAELWVSDGTPQATFLLKDIRPGAEGSFPSESVCNQCGGVVATRDFVFFAADDGVDGRELWRTDGTPNGTVMVKELAPPNDIGPIRFAVLNDVLYFVILFPRVGNNGELWRSDGTADGTRIVADIVPGSGGPLPGNLTVVDGTLFFSADDGVHGRELWKTDGTEAGTVLVKDINPGANGSFVDPLTNFNGTLFFGAFHPDTAGEPWISDGTEEGTVLLKDINPAGSSLLLRGTEVVGDTLFFAADDGVHGLELWKTDGTEAGTVMVADANPAGDGIDGMIGSVGGVVYFIGDDGVFGREVWRSDGTEEGTWLAADIYPGPGESVPFSGIVAGGILYFRAFSPVYGHELWAVDGRTPAIPAVAPAALLLLATGILGLGCAVIRRRIRTSASAAQGRAGFARRPAGGGTTTVSQTQSQGQARGEDDQRHE